MIDVLCLLEKLVVLLFKGVVFLSNFRKLLLVQFNVLNLFISFSDMGVVLFEKFRTLKVLVPDISFVSCSFLNSFLALKFIELKISVNSSLNGGLGK